MNKVTVTIQGANYIMVGEKTDKEILTIANYVNSEMDKLRKCSKSWFTSSINFNIIKLSRFII